MQNSEPTQASVKVRLRDFANGIVSQTYERYRSAGPEVTPDLPSVMCDAVSEIVGRGGIKLRATDYNHRPNGQARTLRMGFDVAGATVILNYDYKAKPLFSSWRRSKNKMVVLAWPAAPSVSSVRLTAKQVMALNAGLDACEGAR